MNLKYVVCLVLLTAGCSHRATQTEKLPADASVVSSSDMIMEYREVVLANGLKVLLVPDRKLPYVSYTLFVRTGSVDDPKNLSGLNNFLSRMLDKGTKKAKAPVISDTLARMAAPLNVSATSEATFISASTLVRFEKELLTQLKEIVLEPTFPQDEISRLQGQVVAELQRAKDSPSQWAALEFEPYLYGDHPYGRRVLGTEASVRKITRKNILEFYQKNYRPNNAELAVVGNFSANILHEIEEQFGSWQKADGVENKIPHWQISEAPTKVLTRPGLSQAEVRIGAQGIPRNHPDYLALRMANAVLGESMLSRIMGRLRVDLGLTYGAYSTFDFRREDGAFVISFSTRTEKLDEAINEATKVVEEFRKNGITKDELARSKAQLMGLFPLLIETPEKLATQLLLLRLYGVDDSYLPNFVSKVEKMSLADVNSAISRHFDLSKKRILIIRDGK